MKKLILSALLLPLLQISYGQIGFPINVDFTVSGIPYWRPTATCMPGVAYQFISEAAPVCSRNFYQWTFFGSNIRISDPSARNPTVIFPASIHDMVYSVKLTVDAINSSPNEICRGCSNASCNVFIDGNVVKEQSGNPAAFVPGSSFVGFGKRVTVKTLGTCSNPASTPITGSLRLHK